MQHSMKRVTTIKQQVCIIVPCMECCGHAEIVYYAFQLIEKKVKKGSIKESSGPEMTNNSKVHPQRQQNTPS